MIFVSYSHAGDVQFEWTQNPPGTEGYRLFMDSTMIVDDIPFTTTTIKTAFPDDGRCHNYFLRAFAGNLESGNSDIPTVCVPEAVHGFKITILIEPTG